MTLHGIAFTQLCHAGTGSPHRRQIHVDLLPPDLSRVIVLETDTTVYGCSVQRGGSDDPRSELQTEYRVHRIIDKGPRSVPHQPVLTHAKEAKEIVENTVRLFELNVKAESLEE